MVHGYSTDAIATSCRLICWQTLDLYLTDSIMPLSQYINRQLVAVIGRRTVEQDVSQRPL